MNNDDLIERANGKIKLGKMTGTHTGNPINIYQIAEELLAALEADHEAIWREGYCAGTYRAPSVLPPTGNQTYEAWQKRQERRSQKSQDNAD